MANGRPVENIFPQGTVPLLRGNEGKPEYFQRDRPPNGTRFRPWTTVAVLSPRRQTD